MPNRFYRGFTVLELLVVVFIVAILAAVAVPQYKVAVERVHYMRLQNLTRKLVQAYQRYYTANGEVSLDFDVLDIQMPPRPGSMVDSEGVSHPYPPPPYPFGNADGENSTGYITAQYDKIQIAKQPAFVIFVAHHDSLPSTFKVMWWPQKEKLVELCDFFDEDAPEGRRLCHAAGARYRNNMLAENAWTW